MESNPLFPGIPAPSASTDMDEIWERTRTAAKESLYFFATAVLGWNKLRPRPHKEMCDFIQRQDRKRKVMLIPRDCYKSTIISKTFPLWVLIQDDFCGIPGREHRILLESFASENAQKQIRSIKQQVERNMMLQWLFPELIPNFSEVPWSDTALRFPRDGMYGEETIEAAGIDTHVVSRHYTIQVRDDLEDKQSSESPTVRERVKSFYRSSEALFVEERSAFDVIVGTRWGTNDLYDDIYRNERDVYDIMCRPLHWDREMLEHEIKTAREEKRPPVWDLDPVRDAPDPTKKYFFFEELFPEDSCTRIKQKQGTWMYSMLYLNNPQDPSLAEFKMRDVQYFTFNDEGDLLLEHLGGDRETVSFDSLTRVMHWDPALTEQDVKKNCDNAQVVMFKDPQGRLYVADAYGKKTSPGILCDRFISVHQRYHIHRASIEDAGFQRLLKFPLYAKMRERQYSFPVSEDKPIGDKHARIRTLIPYCESHVLYVKRGLSDLLEQMRQFPLFPKVDILDAAAACIPALGIARRQQSRTQRSVQRGSQEQGLATRDSRTGY